MIMRFPGFQQHAAGSISHAFTTCMDIMPTLLSLAGVSHPNSTPDGPRHKAPYRGHMVYPMRGKSLVPYLRDGIKASDEETQAVHGDSDPAVGWELHGRASIRKGDWKIVNMPLSAHGSGGWQLYNLAVDQGEIRDLALEYPAKLQEMVILWARYEEETGTVFGAPIAADGPKLIPKDQVGGDPMDDVKAWMRVGVGFKLTAETSPREE